MGMTSGEAAASQAWFDEARLGLFVHFGLYSVAARHEWVMTRERTDPSEYARYADFFDPDRFDARAIALAARDAGMGYAVLTTKHHDGFCLWDSKHSSFTSQTACGRDLVAEFVEAARAEGLRVGLYHSLLDWSDPDYPIDYHHPLRDRLDGAELNRGRDMARYRERLHAQVSELLTDYGQIDYLFFDFTYDKERDGWPGKGPLDWGATELLATCRRLQPQMLVNDRLGIPADMVTPEQYMPSAPMLRDGEPVRWEACQTMNGSWGYDRDNLHFKPVDMLVRMLAETVSLGGNLLLNVGPDGRGGLAAADRTALAGLGEWMSTHAPSIVGAGPADFPVPSGCVATRRGDRGYVHLFSWPFAHLHLPGMADRVRFARLLNDGSEVSMLELASDQEALTTQPGGQPPGTLTLNLPVGRPEVAVPVIELFLT